MKSGVSIRFVDKPVHQASGLSTSARRPSHSVSGSGTVLEVPSVLSPIRQLLLSKQPSDGNGVVGVKVQYEIGNLLTFGRAPEKFPLVRLEFFEPPV
jgi:hypothetical protein